MKERLLSLVGGFILSLGIIVGAIYFFSRPTEIKMSNVEPIEPASLDTIKNSTKSLNNYGNLPKSVSAPDLGRTNPFDDY